MNAPLLATENLDVEIAGRSMARQLALRVEPGQCWCMLGPNGAGKTTLLHTLAGLRPAAHGEIFIAGRPLAGLSARHRARLAGILLQDHEDPFPCSVMETVLAGRHPHLGMWAWETGADLERAREALARLDLAGFADRDIGTLSGGERRRVGLASLLVQDTPLLLLDEPTNHLDLRHQIGVLELLTADLARHDRAVVMVLHDLNLAARFADHLLLIETNGTVHLGEAADLLRGELLETVFGHPLAPLAGMPWPVWLPL